MAAAARPRRRRRTRRRWVAPLVVTGGLLAVAVAAVWAVVAVLQRGVALPVDTVCRAEVDGTGWRLSPVQADNAALIAAMSVRRGLPARAATVGLATALQESRLENIDYGDRDSVGLFQQRPSQGWGTVEQIMDPVYATGIFFDHLVQVAGWTELPVTEAAQAVQRSAFPDAYAQHESRARAFASALTGWSTAALTCTLTPADEAGSPDAVLARVERDLGALPSSATAASPDGAAPATVSLDATPLAADDPVRAGWAAAQWAVAVAQPLSLDAVAVADRVWTRGTDGWQPTETPLGPAQVVLTLAP